MKMRWTILLLSLLISTSYGQIIVEMREPLVLSPTSVKLQGEMLSNPSANITDIYFAYAEYSDYGMGTLQAWPYVHTVTSSATPTVFNATITNLLPETEYIVRVFASNSVENAWSPVATNFWTPADTGTEYPYFKVYGIPDGVMTGAPQTFTVEPWFGTTQLVTYTGTVFFSSQHPETDFPTSYTFTPADAGSRTFTNAVIFNRIGPHNAIEVIDSIDGGMRGEQRDILAFAGYTDTAEALAVWNYPWRSYTGEIHSISVAAVDSSYNLATNYFGTVTFSSSDSIAWLPFGGSATYGFTAQDGGWRTFTNDFGFNTVGVHWIQVEDTGNALMNKQWDLIAMGEGTSTQATHLVVRGDRFMHIGEPNRIEIMAHNAYEQLVENFEGFVSFNSSDANAIYPTNQYFSTFDMGHLVLDDFIIMQTPGSHSLGAVCDANPSVYGSLGPIEVFEQNMPQGTNLFIEIKPVAVVGQELDITITAVDPDGFVLTNYTGDVMFETDDPGAMLPSSVFFSGPDGGQITLSNAVSWSESGLQELRAYDISNTNVTAEADVEVFNGGATNTQNLTIFIRENPMFVGTSNNLMVIALDDFGRVNTNYQQSITFSNSHSGIFTQNPISNVFTEGIAFLPDQFTPTMDGYQTVSVSQTDTPQINGEVSVLVVGGDKRFVDARNGSDINDGLTPSSAWQTLSYAVPMIGQGQALVIAPGYYTNGITYWGASAAGPITAFYGDRHKRFFGRYGNVRINTMDGSPGIDLTGQNDIIVAHIDVEYPTTTPGSTGVVIRTSNNTTLFDCLVWNANTKGVLIEDSPITTLDQCFIEENGYGVYVTGNSPNLLLDRCDIERNDLEGIVLFGATGANIFQSWISYNGGYGIYFAGSQGTVDHCWIGGNQEDGVYVESVGASAWVNRSVLMGNGGAGARFMSADAGSEVLQSIAIFNDTGIAAEAGQPVSIRNSIIYANANNGLVADFGGTLSNSYNSVFGNATNWAGTAAIGMGEIEADPLFASLTPDQEDLHLKSTTGRYSPNGWVVDAESSPAIDSGDPGTGIGNEPMPNGGIVNMGIYGGTREASMSPAPPLHDIIATAYPGGTIAPSGTVSIVNGSNVTFSITPDLGHHIFDVVVAGSSVGATNAYSFVNVTNGSTIEAYFDINEYTLNVESPHGTPIPSGLTTNAWGTSITADIDLDVTGSTTQYVNTGWVGTGSVPSMGNSNSVTFTLVQNSTIDWLWDTNFWVDIFSGPNGTVDPASDWYADGTNLTLTATPSNGYEFTGWTGDIVTNANPLNITVDTALSVTPVFAQLQYDITATAYTGGSIAPSGTVSVTHGSNVTFSITPNIGHEISDVMKNGSSIGATNSYTFANVTNNGMTIEAFFNISDYTLLVESPHGTPTPAGLTTNAWGTPLNASVDGDVTGVETQYVNTGWIGTGSVPSMGTSNSVSFTLEQHSTIDWLWSTNYWVEIMTDPKGTVDVTTDWYANGTNLTITATPTNGYGFAGWTGDIVTNANPLVITVDGPLTLTPTFATNLLSVTATAYPGGTMTPSGMVSVVNGSNVTFTITPNPGHFILDVMVDGFSIGATNTYTFINVTNNARSIEAYFDTFDYTLGVQSLYGTPVPAGITTNAWGTWINAFVDSNVTTGTTQYANTGWIGTGSAPSMGTSNSVSFSLEQHSTIDWLWSTNYWVEITTDPNGSVDLTSDWYAKGTNLSLTATPAVGYDFTGWTGDVVTNANPLNLSVDSAVTVTPTFVLNQYSITATAGPNGTIAPSGTVWVSHGSNTTFTITPDTGHHIQDVMINGSPIGPTNAYTFMNVTNSGMTIDAYFAINEYTLNVESPHGTPIPAGLTTNNWGTLINASVDSNVTMATEQYINTGWMGAGSVPSMGISNSVSFTIDQNSSIDWLWSTNYWVDIMADPNGTVDLTSDWYANGTNLTITAIPTNGYYFTGWTGDIVTNVNPLNITVGSTLTLTPTFALNQYDITASAGPNGSIAPSGTVWVTHGSNTTFTITPDTGHHIQDVLINGSPMGPTNTYTFMNVTNGGITIDAYFDVNMYTLTYLTSTGGTISGSKTQTVAYGSNGVQVEAIPDPGYSFSQWDDGVMTAQRQELSVSSNIMATALFTINQHILVVSSAHGSPLPVVGSNTYNWGSSISATVDAVQVSGTTRYINTGWTGTGSVPSTGTTNSVMFVITNSSSLTWNWLTEYRLTAGTPTNGSVDVSSQWVLDGNTVVLTATPSAGYIFDGWLGDVPVADVNMNPLSVTMDQARSLVPQFILDEGSISVEINYAADVSGARWRLTTGPDTNWKTSGAVVASLPTVGSPYTVTFDTIPYFDTPADITNITVNVGVQTDLMATYPAKMVQIPAGTYNMGITASSPGHPVQLTSFMMDVRTVTIAQFMEFANATSLPMPIPPTWNGNTNLTWATLNPQLPMVNVTWNQAKAYADWIGKRLPTEAEFEYAMRNGLPNSSYPWGNSITPADANYDNTIMQPTPAGTYAGTSYGLYDIVGNVWEWCGDWHGFIPEGGATITDPQGPATGMYKTIRGGSFITRSSRLQTPWRFYYTPNTRSTDLGFRCVAPVAATPAPNNEPVPTWWVEWNFGAGSGNETGEAFSADQDTDQDGMTDGNEFAGGYDPNDAGSVLKVTSSTPSVDQATIKWQSVENKTYAIERSAQGGVFVTIATGIKATFPLNTYIDTPEGDGPWFYRVVVEP